MDLKCVSAVFKSTLLQRILLLHANSLSHKAELSNDKKDIEAVQVKLVKKKLKTIRQRMMKMKSHIISAAGRSSLPVGNPLKPDWPPILGVTW